MLVVGWPSLSSGVQGDVEANYLKTTSWRGSPSACVAKRERFGGSVSNFFRKPFRTGLALVVTPDTTGSDHRANPRHVPRCRAVLDRSRRDVHRLAVVR
jgi:hypothetical protein